MDPIKLLPQIIGQVSKICTHLLAICAKSGEDFSRQCKTPFATLVVGEKNRYSYHSDGGERLQIAEGIEWVCFYC